MGHDFTRMVAPAAIGGSAIGLALPPRELPKSPKLTKTDNIHGKTPTVCKPLNAPVFALVSLSAVFGNFGIRGNGPLRIMKMNFIFI
jgi:hypothetical protein